MNFRIGDDEEEFWLVYLDFISMQGELNFFSHKEDLGTVL